MYYRSGTGRHCCVDVVWAFTAGDSRVLCEMTSWPSSWNSDITVKNPTMLKQLIDVYLRQEHSYQISSWSDLKRRSLGLFFGAHVEEWHVAPTRTRWVAAMRSVPDLKKSCCRFITKPTMQWHCLIQTNCQTTYCAELQKHLIISCKIILR